MNIHVSKDFGVGYLNSFQGLGSEVINSDGSVVKLRSPAGLNNGAMKQWFFVANEGDEIEYEVFARNIKGDARISFDLIQLDSAFTSGFHAEKVLGSDFKLYKGKIKIPYGKDYVQCGMVFGTWNSISDDSESEFMLPKIKVNGAAGVLQTIACGLLQVNNGVASLNNWYKRVGVKSVSYSDVTRRATVVLNRSARLNFYPTISVNSHIDKPQFFPVVGSWQPATNSFEIGLSNGTALTSMASGGNHIIYFEVKA